MINNRQNGRRRGRGGGGQRQGGGGGGQGQRDSGNRIDSRARGNANQLYEKYKNMARDAQMSGDRVTTEYYLQFADHYFRVLMDQRGRFEDQPQQRRSRDDFDPFDNGDDDFGADFPGEGEPIRGDEQPRSMEGERLDQGARGRLDGRGEQREQRPREGRPQRDERPRRDDREPRVEREVAPDTRAEARQAVPVANPVPVANDIDAPAGDVEEPRRRRARKPRGDMEAPAPATDAPLGIDRLPPALGVAATGESDAADDAPKPRRRRVRTAAAEADASGA